MPMGAKKLLNYNYIMRHFALIFFLVATATGVFAVERTEYSKTITSLIDNNFSCPSAHLVCKNTTQSFRFTPLFENHCDPNNALYYLFQFAGPAANGISVQLTGGVGVWEWYGPFQSYNLDVCQQINTYNASFQTGAIGGANTPPVLGGSSAGFYLLKLKQLPCNGTIDIKIIKAQLNCNENVLCEECVTSFSPSPGKYIISAWVKEGNSSYTVTSYQNSAISIAYSGATNTYSLLPKGSIIDGWQRIEEVIEIPNTATGMEIQLTTSSEEAFFDDIRFFPFDGSMMSYVYDPISLRLMAQLDERNYATLYEYDEEGKLIRLKKETEKGIMTIQENRENIKKGF